MTAPQSYGTAPQIIEGRTFVPAKKFELMGYQYNAVGQFVNFEKLGLSTECIFDIKFVVRVYAFT